LYHLASCRLNYVYSV